MRKILIMFIVITLMGTMVSATVVDNQGSGLLPNEVSPLMSIYQGGKTEINTTPTAADALSVLQAAVGKIEITPKERFFFDFDGNNEVSASDALSVLQVAVGKIDTSLSPPFLSVYSDVIEVTLTTEKYDELKDAYSAENEERKSVFLLRDEIYEFADLIDADDVVREQISGQNEKLDLFVAVLLDEESTTSVKNATFTFNGACGLVECLVDAETETEAYNMILLCVQNVNLSVGNVDVNSPFNFVITTDGSPLDEII